MITEIIKGVFIGDENTAHDFSFFVINKIKRVVNCTTHIPCYYSWVQYYRVPLLDSSDEENNQILEKHLPTILQFIFERNEEENVLIHCQAGVSRSCSVAAAAVRVCCASTLDEAIAIVIAKRPIAFFNGLYFNFKTALTRYFGENGEFLKQQEKWKRFQRP